MSFTRRWILSALLPIVASACAITQTARPVALQPTDASEMCVVDDPEIDETILPAYRAALERRGFAVKLLPPGTSPAACPLSSTYYAEFSWDFVPYMSVGRIVVYRDGTQAGEAIYDAPKGGTAMTFRIYESTSSKIDTMVGQLFPGRPSRARAT